jgi:hypothetical protein
MDQGCQIFSWYNIPKLEKYNQFTLNYTNLPQNIPNGRKMDQMAIKYLNIFHFRILQNLPKLGFQGLKIYHLATLVWTLFIQDYRWNSSIDLLVQSGHALMTQLKTMCFRTKKLALNRKLTNIAENRDDSVTFSPGQKISYIYILVSSLAQGISKHLKAHKLIKHPICIMYLGRGNFFNNFQHYIKLHPYKV